MLSKQAGPILIVCIVAVFALLAVDPGSEAHAQTPPGFDDAFVGALKPGWSWLRGDGRAYFKPTGGLCIPADTASSLHFTRNILLRPIPTGDFAIHVLMGVCDDDSDGACMDFVNPATGAVLLYLDDSNYVKAGLGAGSAGSGDAVLFFEVVMNGTRVDSGAQLVCTSGRLPYIAVENNSIKIYYYRDAGGHIYEDSSPLPFQPTQVGIMASGAGTDFVHFQKFLVRYRNYILQPPSVTVREVKCGLEFTWQPSPTPTPSLVYELDFDPFVGPIRVAHPNTSYVVTGIPSHSTSWAEILYQSFQVSARDTLGLVYPGLGGTNTFGPPATFNQPLKVKSTFKRRILVGGSEPTKVMIQGFAGSCATDSLSCDLDVLPSWQSPSTRQITYAVFDSCLGSYARQLPVEIVVRAQDTSGGHCAHRPNRPSNGMLSTPPQVVYTVPGNTAATGLGFAVTHTWPEVSGYLEVEFHARPGVAPPAAPFYGDTQKVFHYAVRIPNLIELPENQALYSRVGGQDNQSRHPVHHSGNPSFVSLLTEVAQEFNARTGLKFEYNDLSLPWGGVFEVEIPGRQRNVDWSPDGIGHYEHRVGQNCDLRARVLQQPARRIALQIMRNRNIGVVGHPSSCDLITACNHWHLRAPGAYKNPVPGTDLQLLATSGADRPTPTFPPPAISVVVDSSGQDYVYTYTIANPAGSTSSVETFAVALEREAVELDAPANWSSSVGYRGYEYLAAWYVVEPGTAPPGWVDQGHNLYASSYAVTPGTQQSGFVVTSPFPPREVDCLTIPFEDIIASDDPPQTPTLASVAVWSRTLGPGRAVTSVDRDPIRPTPAFRASPNPSSNTVSLTFEVASPSDVNINVYDVSGRLVRALQLGQQEPGNHEVSWDTHGLDGKRLPSGVYFAQLSANRRTIGIARMVIVR